MPAVALLRGGVDEKAVAIVNILAGFAVKGASVLPRIGSRTLVERVPVAEAGDAVLGKQPRSDAVIDRRIIDAPYGGVAALEDKDLDFDNEEYFLRKQIFYENFESFVNEEIGVGDFGC